MEPEDMAVVDFDGRTVEDSLRPLEIVAEIALKTLQLNPAISAIPEALLDKHFLRKHGVNAYYGQPVDASKE
jgi:ribulose-5-phosphate 4-epimerase/fuculose-1-phosphate aldolase